MLACMSGDEVGFEEFEGEDGAAGWEELEVVRNLVVWGGGGEVGEDDGSTVL